MITRNPRRDWAECPRDEKASRWASLYITLNCRGDIVLSRFTYEALGEPAAFVLLYDNLNHTIGLRPARPSIEKNAYPARSQGRHGGKVVRGFRLCKEFGIRIDRTVKFPFAEIDNDGVLLLDLRETRDAARLR